jgi:hypothetical protein
VEESGEKGREITGSARENGVKKRIFSLFFDFSE